MHFMSNKKNNLKYIFSKISSKKDIDKKYNKKHSKIKNAINEIKTKQNDIEGVYRVGNRTCGFVMPLNSTDEIYVRASDSLNALTDDKVIVRITKASTYDKKKEGKIIKILERSSDTIVGYFKLCENYAFVIPINKKIPFDVHIEKKNFGLAVNDSIVVVKFSSPKHKKDNPEGIVVSVIGHKDDPNDEISAIVEDFNIKNEFDIETTNEANEVAIDLINDDYKDRRDLRDKNFVTIDGEDTKDIDDAVCLENLSNGNVKLYVSIADVSHYVLENSFLDKEALKRGNSVYLLDRVIPMIPHVLSNGMCSLNPHVDRLTMTCEIEYDKNANVLSYDIYESVINSHRRMTYNEVQAILDDIYIDDLSFEKNSLPTDIKKMMFDMITLSRKLREYREKRGSINFNIKETYIEVDENLKPIGVFEKKRIESMELIEDFMVAANEKVAEHFCKMKVPFLYRTHEECDREKIMSLSLILSAYGINYKFKNKITPKDIQKLLKKVEGEPFEYVIEKMTLRCMKQAKYTKDPIGHFALASKYYTHFTSPIRRYSDLQIHRIMKEIIENKFDEERNKHYNSILDNVADKISKLERLAIECERDVNDLKKCEYMQDYIGEEYIGIISGLTNFGIFVELDNSIEGMIPLRDIKEDHYIFDEIHYKIYGERSGEEFTYGQKLKIRVAKVSKELRAIDFAIVR